MIWIIHYILFNAGMASVLCLMSVFLKHHCTETSISEIGVLLMALPFISTFVKPICCAIADRHRAHKACLMLSLFILGTCYGAITIPCFFKSFMEANARLVWYMYIVLIIIGYSAFGVVFCLADCLSLNCAIQRGISWGYFRIWAVISWGVCGSIVGTFNETPLLPKYTPGFLVLFGSSMIEIIVIAVWPNSAFAMDSDAIGLDAGGHGLGGPSKKTGGADGSMKQLPGQDSKDESSTNISKSDQSFGSSSHQEKHSSISAFDHHRGSFDGNGTLGKGSTARLNPRLLASIANMVVEEVGSNLKSSLRLNTTADGGARGRQRTGLADLIGAEALAEIRSKSPSISVHRDPTLMSLQDNVSNQLDTATVVMYDEKSEQQQQQQIQQQLQQQHVPQGPPPTGKPAGGLAGTIGRAALRKTQLGLNRMNSLSSASGIAIFDDLQREAALYNQSQQQLTSTSNLASGAATDGDNNSINSSVLHLAHASSPGADNLLMNTLKHHHMNQNHKGSLSRASGKLLMSQQSIQQQGQTPTSLHQSVQSMQSQSSQGGGGQQHSSNSEHSDSTTPTQSQMDLNAASSMLSAFGDKDGDKTTLSSVIDLTKQHPQNMLNSSSNNNDQHQLHQSQLQLQLSEKQLQHQSNFDLVDERKIGQDLQLVLLRIILKRNTATLKYLILFVVMGILMWTHVTYFFMHAEKLAHEWNYDFSKVAGIFLLAHAFSEVFAFIVIAQFYMPRVGRTGSIMTAAMVCAIRFGYYGTYFKDNSLYYAIITETVHGIGYGIIYTLMSDFARETVDHVDQYLPELVDLGLIDARMNPIYLKLPLRATMQGIFSGAFDGLGNGIGVLAGGLYLEHHDYVGMWLWCFYLSVALFFIYPLTEWRSWPFLKRNRR